MVNPRHCSFTWPACAVGGCWLAVLFQAQPLWLARAGREDDHEEMWRLAAFDEPADAASTGPAHSNNSGGSPSVAAGGAATRSPFANSLPLTHNSRRASLNVVELVKRPPSGSWLGGKVEDFWLVPGAAQGGSGAPDSYTLCHFTSRVDHSKAGDNPKMQTVSLLFAVGVAPYASAEMPMGHPGKDTAHTFVVHNLISAMSGDYVLPWPEDAVRRKIFESLPFGPWSRMANSSTLHESLRPGDGLSQSIGEMFLGPDVDFVVPGEIVGYMVTELSPYSQEKQAQHLEISFEEIANSKKGRGLGRTVFQKHIEFLKQHLSMGSQSQNQVEISIHVYETNEAATYWSKMLGVQLRPGDLRYEVFGNTLQYTWEE